MRTYIVGTSHVYQRPPPTRRVEAALLRDYLVEVGRRCRIGAIGEELHPDHLRGRDLERSTCADAAIELGIEHRYCDPSPDGRNSLGIPSGEKGYSARERYWMQCLLDLDRWPCLFVCGAYHVGSFSTLLAHNKLVPVVACKNWAPNYSLKRNSNKLL
jgi:hypothetical protein